MLLDVQRQYSDEQTNSGKMIRGLSTKLNLSTKCGQRYFETLIHQPKQQYRYNVSHYLRRNPTRALSSVPSDNLPRQPVPALDQTLQKYLLSVRPLLDDKSYKTTEKLVANFGCDNSNGSKLQVLLLERAKCTDNWLSDWWLKTAYLGYRATVVVNSNPGLYFPKQQFECEVERLTYAAKIVWASLKYKEMIDNNQIAPEKVGKFMLDMGQYKKIFGTCRIPQREIDGIQFNPLSRHIVVLHKNAFYSVRVYDEQQPPNVLSEKEIFQQLQTIVEQSKTDDPAVGILTTLDRDTLAEAYERLHKDPKNKSTIDSIQKSLFILCLDKSVAQSNEDELDVASHQLIHGGGPRENSGNRWFDKTLQFIVNENGLNGITYEHSPAEGQPIAILTDFIFKHLKSRESDKNYSKLQLTKLQPYQQPQKLEFNLSKETEHDIEHAKNYAKSLAENLHMKIVHYKGYGKNFIKQYKMSPDSYIQMAMQLAYFKLHSMPAAQYETGQQRMFLHGRTETIRSCSIESIEFAKSMLNTTSTDQCKLQALRNAVEAHKKYTVMAMTGYGIDRHLLGLKLLANEHNIPVSDFYSDDGYVKSTHFSVATSQVASNAKSFMCYGPVVEDGYGICYNPRNDDMFFAISSMHSCKTTCSNKMANTLIEAFELMQSLLIRTELAKSKL